MARREIDTIWDRETRNNINENFIELYNEYIGAGLDAKEAKQKAEQALNIANQSKQQSQRAEDKADNVQEQFNQVVIEGDSSVEAAQARVDADNNVYDTLKERLDTKDIQTSQKIEVLNNKTDGMINIEEFPRLPGEDSDDLRIKRAIDFLGRSGTGIGKLIFADKEYIIKDFGIFFDTRGLTLEGTKATVLKAAEGYTGWIIKSWQSERTFSTSLRTIKLKGFNINGNGTANGISLTGFNYGCGIEDVRITNCVKPLEIANSWGFKVDAYVEYNERGIVIGSPETDPGLSEHVVNGASFEGTKTSYNNGFGIELNNCRVVSLNGMLIEKNSGGVYLNQENRVVTIKNAYIEDNPEGNIIIGNPQRVVPRDITIEDSWIYQLDDNDINIGIYRVNGLKAKRNKYYKLGMQDHANAYTIFPEDPNNITELDLDVSVARIVNSNLLDSKRSLSTHSTRMFETTNLLGGASGQVRYWKDDSGTVHVEVRNLECGGDTRFFDLPEDYRPINTILLPAITLNNGTFPVQISPTTGAMTLRGNNSIPSGHFNISFRGKI